MPACSACRYVRLNALNVPHIPLPRFIAPLKDWVKIYQVKNFSILAVGLHFFNKKVEEKIVIKEHGESQP